MVFGSFLYSYYATITGWVLLLMYRVNRVWGLGFSEPKSLDSLKLYVAQVLLAFFLGAFTTTPSNTWWGKSDIAGVSRYIDIYKLTW